MPTNFYDDITDLIDLHHSVGQAVILKGRIGEGKTSLLSHMSSRDSVTLPSGDTLPVAGTVTLRLAGKNADTINGIPAKGEVVVDGETFATAEEAVPRWALQVRELASSVPGGAVVYVALQEWNLAYVDALAAAQDMLLDHVLPNGFRLPELVRFIGDMNPRDEVNGAFPLSDAITNRVAIHDFSVPDQDWADALVAGFPGEEAPASWRLHYRSAGAAFLTACPQYIYESRDVVDRSENPWASRRSWTRAFDVLAAGAQAAGGSLPADRVRMILAASVGPRAGDQFASWLSGHTIPTVAEMVDDPGCLDDADVSVAHAAVSSLVTQALSVCSGIDAPAQVPDTPVSVALGVLNHLRRRQADIATVGVLRLVRQAGLRLHGLSVLDPARVEDGFVAPTHPVDPAFGPALGKIEGLQP